MIGRLVSIAAGLGTLLAIYACGARAFGKRAGVFAAAMFARCGVPIGAALELSPSAAARRHESCKCTN